MVWTIWGLALEVATEYSELVAVPVLIVLLLIDRMPFRVFLTFEPVVHTPRVSELQDDVISCVSETRLLTTSETFCTAYARHRLKSPKWGWYSINDNISAGFSRVKGQI